MKYFVYILKSVKNGRYYIGCTKDILTRVKKHNKGQSKYTKGKGPWILKYKEEFKALSEARKRERRIKSWKKRKAIERLFMTGPIV